MAEDSVVITSIPLRKSTLRLFTPGPQNSNVQFFTKPSLNTAPIKAIATSCGPTPGTGLPERYTSTVFGYEISYVLPRSCLTSSPPPSPVAIVPRAP